jgi:tetratricopeptide (TPR) repeat protein/uncharacterized membrane protein YgcG
MNLSEYRKLKWTLLTIFSAAVFCLIVVTQSAQTAVQTPERTGYITDFAGVLPEPARAELSNLLENVKQRASIEFAVVIVDSTAGEDIFDYSQKLARQWNLGARSSSKKSLLMVLSISDRTSFTQFSRSVQGDLPEGVLGEMSQRMRPLVNAGKFSEGLNNGVRHFVNTIAERLAIDAAEFDKPVSVSDQPTSKTVPVVARAETRVNKPAEESPSPAPITTETDPAPTPAPATASATRRRQVVITPRASVVDDPEADSEEVELTLTLAPEARIAKLKEFLANRPDSKSRPRATELLVSAHAALGDDRLKRSDRAGGTEQLMLAIEEAPLTASDRLFSGVIAQIPLNLYVRGERDAATTAARRIEEKFGGNAKRLLALGGFYLGTEQGTEAARLAAVAVSLSPDLAEAHQALGLAMHISLRLEDAVNSYKRALELNPDLKGARRALADLQRGFGRSEDALAMYRQALAVDPKDKNARTGMILALLDVGRIDEAKQELNSTLSTDPANLPLLAGAAYWFAAHNDPQQALELGTKALAIEPRYTWSQIAVARALIARNNPVAAERAIRYAKQYGRFPTLDYELATALAAESLYEEAAEVLMQSFSLRDGNIQTLLGGQFAASNTNFTELLAPERRAGIFQSVAPDSERNAKLLKDLLRFTTIISGEKINEQAAITAARQFASGDDAAVAHRQLFAASRLLQKGIGFAAAYELAEAARATADAGLTVPNLTVAVQADEYRDIRARAIAQGGTLDIPEAPRNVLSNILRGRIEDLSGWALFNQDKSAEAAAHLKRAANILPPGTPSWRNSVWRLGATLERLDQKEEALAQYIRSYNSGEPDPVRRNVIERLYRQVKGSLDGLDQLIQASATASRAPVSTSAPDLSTSPAQQSPSPESSPIEAAATPSPSTDASPAPTPEASPAPAEPTSTPEAVPTPASTPEPPSQRSSFDPRPDNIPTPKATKPEVKVVTITGRITDSSNNPVANVVVVLVSPQGSVLASTTDVDGIYSFKVAPSSHSYRLIPSKDGFTFEPVDRVLADATADQKEVSFVATAKKS